jgi:hypothetical protein
MTFDYGTSSLYIFWPIYLRWPLRQPFALLSTESTPSLGLFLFLNRISCSIRGLESYFSVGLMAPTPAIVRKGRESAVIRALATHLLIKRSNTPLIIIIVLCLAGGVILVIATCHLLQCMKQDGSEFYTYSSITGMVRLKQIGRADSSV